MSGDTTSTPERSQTAFSDVGATWRVSQFRPLPNITSECHLSCQMEKAPVEAPTANGIQRLLTNAGNMDLRLQFSTLFYPVGLMANQTRRAPWVDVRGGTTLRNPQLTFRFRQTRAYAKPLIVHISAWYHISTRHFSLHTPSITLHIQDVYRICYSSKEAHLRYPKALCR